MSYQEKDFQSDFTRWLRENAEGFGLDFTFAYELKICKQKRFPFSRIEPHQITSLKRTKDACQRHKISDSAIGFKPYDGYQICYSPAYLIILWYTPRKAKCPIWIDIDDFLSFRENEGKEPKKSITEEEALTIGKTYGKI